MAPSAQPPTFSSAEALLSTFEYERLLSEDPRTLVLYLLGTAVPDTTGVRSPAILKLEKTPYEPGEIASLASRAAWDKLQVVTANDIYATILGWLAPSARTSADIQLSSICPATEKHIKKYSVQSSRLVRETPELYKSVVEPYIDSIPKSQISWLYNILEGTSEAENVIYRDEDPVSGFVLAPDLKWDQKTMSALYLLVLSQARDIRCLRDLRPSHLPLLRKIRHESERAAVEKYGIDKNELRFFIHYHPTYYHFHVHITHLSYQGFPGITVGQSHLLDDVIDNLEFEEPSGNVETSYYARRTLTYALGTENPLYKKFVEAETNA